MYHTFWECVLVITCLFPLNSTETWLWHSTLLNDVELLKFYSYPNRWHVEYVLKVALVAWWVLLYVVILSAVHVGEVCQFGTKYLFVYVEFLFTWNEVHFISYCICMMQFIAVWPQCEVYFSCSLAWCNLPLPSHTAFGYNIFGK